MKPQWKAATFLVGVALLFGGYKILFATPPVYHLTDLGEIGRFEDIRMYLNEEDRLLVFTRTLENKNPVDLCQIWEDGAAIHSLSQEDFGSPFLVADFNDASQFVGLLQRGENTQGFRWDPEEGLVTFPVTYIASINDHGVMVGTTTVGDATARQPCMIHPTGEVEMLIDHLGEGSGPMRINNSGRILCSKKVAPGDPRKYVIWDEGEESFLGEFPPGAAPPESVIPVEMNQLGQVVGWTRSRRAFRTGANGKISNLWMESGMGNQHAWDLNDIGDVVGEIQFHQSNPLPSFLYRFRGAWGIGKVIRSIDSRMNQSWHRGVIFKNPKVIVLQDKVDQDHIINLTSALTINNNGLIAGRGIDDEGKNHVFLLTPIDHVE